LDVRVLGLDGGNTKTVALVARSDGTIVGTGRSGCADIYGASSPGEAIDAIRTAVNAALAEGALLGAVDSGVFSLAGADWPEDIAFYRAELDRELGLGSPPIVVNDAIGALRAGSPDGTGVSVVCGTHGAVGGRGPDGRVWHASFWLEPSGASELGRQALQAVTRSALGIDPPSSLTPGFLDLFGETTPEALLHRFTRRKDRADDVARAARILLDEAEHGDETARRIVIEHGLVLGDYARVAAREVGLTELAFPLVFAGGVFQHPSNLLLDTIAERVRSSVPGARPAQAQLPPAAGSLLLALEAAGVATDEAVLNRLRQTLPSPALFAT
jgi:N-acetylglucosamine kinase-like BadF-type ATPase